MKRSCAGADGTDIILIDDDDSSSALSAPPQKKKGREPRQMQNGSLKRREMNTEARTLRSAKRTLVAASDKEVAEDKPAEKTAETGETKQKSAVVDEEESTKDEPVEKPCCQLDLNLEEKLAKLEKDYQGACRIANEYEEKVAKLEKNYQGVCRIANEYEQGMNQAKQRVELLENLIDKKPKVSELDMMNMEKETKEKTAELQQKVNSLTLQLEAEKSRASEDRKRDSEKIADLAGKVAFLESDRQHHVDESKRIYLVYHKSIDELTRKLAEKVKQHEAVDKSRKVDQERIDELSRKLAEYEKEKNLPPKIPLEMNPLPSQLSAISKEMAYNNQAVNILSMWSPTQKTIAFDKAAMQLRVFLGKNFTKGFEEIFKIKDLTCLSCTETLSCRNVLSHFFSKQHVSLMRVHKAEVSLDAFLYWLSNLKKISAYKDKDSMNGVPEVIEISDDSEIEEGEIIE